MVQSGGADAADVHAGTLADRLEPLENGDVFRGVVRGCHVYSRVKRRSLLPVDDDCNVIRTGRLACCPETRRRRQLNGLGAGEGEAGPLIRSTAGSALANVTYRTPAGLG